jgi:hypothetical protein
MLRIITGALPLVILCAGALSAQNPAAPKPFFCAQEGGTCRFAGMGMAYFGAGNVFAVRTMTDGVACTTAVFGDPAPNVAKYCLTSALPAQEAECAPEGRSCAVSGPALMLYGANGVYSGRVVSQATLCSASVFGDPAPNVTKSCWLVNAPPPPPASPPAPVAASAPAVRPRQVPPPQVTRVTYATLELPPPVAGYMAANADGSVSLKSSEFMAVFFGVWGKNSPPASGDLVRLADVGGKSVLVSKGDGSLAMQTGLAASGPQYLVRALNPAKGAMADGATFELQAADGRLIKFDIGVMKLIPAPADGLLNVNSVIRIHIHTLAQINELQAQQRANGNVLAQPQIRRGN